MKNNMWIVGCVAAITAMSWVSPTLMARIDEPAATEKPAEEKKKVDPVDFRKLREAMPAKIAGLDRGKSSGQKSKFGELTISTAEAQYGNPNDTSDAPPSGQLTLIDYANEEMVMAMTGGIFGMTEIDQESDEGWTKTMQVQDRHALVQWQIEGKVGTVTTSAGKRILVSFELRNVDEAAFKAALEELPLKALDALVPASE